mmetsp:Transcript_57898/g.188236  ORF Transcript_57898/g.188236 Transcript_57898/m.188236 type:complete len:229 (+) Transcript_57898:3706-4392(+)
MREGEGAREVREDLGLPPELLHSAGHEVPEGLATRGHDLLGVAVGVDGGRVPGQEALQALLLLCPPLNDVLVQLAVVTYLCFETCSFCGARGGGPRRRHILSVSDDGGQQVRAEVPAVAVPRSALAAALEDPRGSADTSQRPVLRTLLFEDVAGQGLHLTRCVALRLVQIPTAGLAAAAKSRGLAGWNHSTIGTSEHHSNHDNLCKSPARATQSQRVAWRCMAAPHAG